MERNAITEAVHMEISESSRPRNEIVECPFCRKGRVSVTFVPAYISWNVSRIASGAKRTKFVHDAKTIVNGKCPECGKSKQEIKEVLESGKPASHEEQIKRLKDAGLPTKFESSVR